MEEYFDTLMYISEYRYFISDGSPTNLFHSFYISLFIVSYKIDLR